jgi:hypothetical protein
VAEAVWYRLPPPACWVHRWEGEVTEWVRLGMEMCARR